MKSATARAPLQRTMSGGISLATLKANTRRMAGASLGRPAHRLQGVRLARLGIEKAEVLVPGNVHQHLESVFARPGRGTTRGDVVDADEVGAQLANLGEIPGGLLARGEGAAPWR